MSDLDRIKKLAGILTEEMDKGDMHDALGDAMNSLQDAGSKVRAVSDEIESTLYTDESATQQVDEGAKENMPFMQAIMQYVEDQQGNIIGDYDVDEPRLYLDVGSMAVDMQKMLEKKYPDVEIITRKQDPSTYFKDLGAGAMKD